MLLQAAEFQNNSALQKQADLFPGGAPIALFAMPAAAGR
jgi:hypothetical protein